MGRHRRPGHQDVAGGRGQPQALYDGQALFGGLLRGGELGPQDGVEDHDAVDGVDDGGRAEPLGLAAGRQQRGGGALGEPVVPADPGERVHALERELVLFGGLQGRFQQGGGLVEVPFAGEGGEEFQGLAGNGRQTVALRRLERGVGEFLGQLGAVRAGGVECQVGGGHIDRGGAAFVGPGPQEGSGLGYLSVSVLPAARGVGHLGEPGVQRGEPGGAQAAAAEGVQVLREAEGPGEVTGFGERGEQGLQGVGAPGGVLAGGEQPFGAAEQGDRGADRAGREGAQAGVGEQAAGLGLVARLGAQLRDEGAPVALEVRVERLHRVRGAAGHRRPVARCELGEQGLGGERVAERVPVRGGFVGDDELGRDAGVQVAEQPAVVDAGHPLEHGQREATADHGGRGQQGQPLRAEPVDAAQDPAGEGGGHVAAQVADHAPAVLEADEGAAADHALEQLLDEEGAAGAVIPEPVQGLLRHQLRFGVQLGGDDRANLGPGERGEFQYGPHAAPTGRVGHVERVAGLRTDRGQEHDVRVLQVVHQVFDDRERLGVGVVQVLQEQELAVLLAGGDEQPQDGLAEDDHGAVVLGVAAPVRDDPAERRPVGAQRQVVQGGSVERTAAEQRHQRFGEWPERDGGAGGAAPAPQGPHARAEGHAHGFGGEPGLSDSGLADEEDDPAAPFARVGQCLLDLPQLRVTTDDVPRTGTHVRNLVHVNGSLCDESWPFRTRAAWRSGKDPEKIGHGPPGDGRRATR